jgi:(S)-citramalyl-CoA lyase
MSHTGVKLARTILFVPGNRPERFAKALGAGADAVVIDLEDAVSASEKTQTRDVVLQWFASRAAGTAPVGIRVNSPYTADGIQDLAMLSQTSARPDFILLPKVESAFEPQLFARLLANGDGTDLICAIETARGLDQAYAIAAAPGVVALAFGGADLAADLRAEFSWDALLHARTSLVRAAAAAQIGVLDVPFLDIRDDTDLAAECRMARALGFTGKFSIHPKHVAAMNTAFSPSDEQIRDAQALIAAFEAAKGSAAEFRGKMIDEAILKAARTVLKIPR